MSAVIPTLPDRFYDGCETDEQNARMIVSRCLAFIRASLRIDMRTRCPHLPEECSGLQQQNVDGWKPMQLEQQRHTYQGTMISALAEANPADMVNN